MASQAAIAEFLETLDLLGYLTERKGAPRLTSPEARAKLGQVWWTLLVDVSDADLAAALAGYLRSPDGQWYPQPGTILAHVPGRTQATIDNSDELWGAVVGAVRSIGYYGSPVWSGENAEAIEAGVQALGGWQHLCATLTAENQMAERASFRQVVRTVHQRKRIATESSTVARITGPKAPQIEDTDAEH